MIQIKQEIASLKLNFFFQQGLKIRDTIKTNISTLLRILKSL